MKNETEQRRIMMRSPSDDVSGQIIGAIKHPAALYYHGRKQGKTIWAESHEAIREMAQAMKREFVADSPHAYPDDTWELRFFY